MSVLKRAKLRTPDGTESIEYPLGVEAENVEVANSENLSQRLARIDKEIKKNEKDIVAVNEIAGTNKQNIGAAEIRIDALEKKNNYTVSSLKTDALIIRGTDGNYYKIIYNTTTSALEVIRA